jgi:outer membrane receptor protein involved in Fe transport
MLRRVHRATLLAVLFVTALLVPLAQAGTTGKLTGKVVNDKKEPLAGVNIRIEGQHLGAITDENGVYTIIGIPAGPNIVRANLLGYAAFVAENVTIVADFSTTLDITLKAEAVQMAEVRVEAERPLLQKDATATSRVISADQIARLPTRGYKDAAAQQTGVVNFGRQIDTETNNGNTLIIRGGRPNETAFFVDGFSQQDPLTGNATTQINNNAIQEVVLLNGGFNAEYGRIMSGVINVITREGSDHYTGSLEAVTDNLNGYGNSFMGTKVYDYNVYDGSFGGPLFKGHDWGTFYYSGQRRWQGDRSPNAVYDGPQANNSLGGWTHQAKLSIPFSKQIDLRLGGLYSTDSWREYLNTYRFDLPHSPRYYDLNQSLTAQINHTLSAKSFYTIGANYFYTQRKRGDGVYFDNVAAYSQYGQTNLRDGLPWFWPGFSGTPGDPLSDSLAATATAANGYNGGNGHVFDDYLQRESSYIGVKGDYTGQVNPYHQMKTGFETDWHTLRYYEAFFPVSLPGSAADINAYGYDDNLGHVNSGRDGPAKPFTGSVYLQDKYERSGVVVNLGLRYDYINTNAKALANENTPLGGNSNLDDSDLTNSKTYSRLSPRLGIGFPVTDKTVMHVNWGQFFQQPNLQDLYVSYQFLEHKIRTGGYYVGFGDPNLKPEQTTAYEVGIAHQLSDYSRLDVTAYYKDVQDLVQVTTIASTPNNFASYRNKDFATIKGIDIGFTLRRINHVAASINYSLSSAVGTGSVSNSQRNIAWTASQPPKQTAPLDFDQRHKLSMNLDYALGRGEGPKWGKGTPLENTSFNVLYNIASGTPFTPTNVYDEVTLAAIQSNPTGPLNSIYGPWTQSFDFKVNKGWTWNRMDMAAYIWVINAFDIKNAVAVYTGTGSATTTGYLNTNEGQNVAANLASQGIDPNAAYNLALANQSLYSNPRMVRFGLRMGF